MTDTIRPYRDRAGQWRWHRKAPNGEIIAQGEGYTRPADLKIGAERANPDTGWKWSHDSGWTRGTRTDEGDLMATARDLNAIASALRDTNAPRITVDRIADALETTSPRFDRPRFIAAALSETPQGDDQ